ncbi:hypothetical protein QBC37DRAFT_188250 [Rhypophila decipiens]|uniref:NAD-dependent epimerase/dehydratase domain-containing protein n=1 Tax=Rhypophila decipiens TaxID=261697 RepID=A0AAN7BAC0_9PEZI|nr:hypothetical protein QBC37DRAFT_188250 [Rhypophila decipiens]
MNVTTVFTNLDLKPEDEVPPSPSSTTTTSSSDLHHSSDNLEEDSPGTTPGAGSENGDPFTYGPNSQHELLEGHGQEDKFILVTGGLGYIGSHTTLELLKQGYNVIVVDNLSNCFASARWRIQHLANQHFQSLAEQACPVAKLPKLHFHKMDYQSSSMRLLLEQYSIRDGASFDEQQDEAEKETKQSQISGVIHFAAYKSVSESITDPLAYYDNNVCGLVGFIRLLDEFNIHNVIFSSSATIYGSKANASKPLLEDQVLHFPSSSSSSQNEAAEMGAEGLTCAYARTKYFCEAILADLAISAPQKWRITCLRYFNPVGCDPSGLLGESPRNTPTNLFPVVAEVLTGKRAKLSVFGTDWPTADGTAIRDYVHVVDIARGHVAALSTTPAISISTVGEKGDLERAFRTYNLGSGTGTSVLEIVESLSQAAERPVPVEWTGRRAGDVGFCVASTARAERELGWFPKESIAQSARDLWNYIRGHGQHGNKEKKDMSAVKTTEVKVQEVPVPSIVVSVPAGISV